MLCQVQVTLLSQHRYLHTVYVLLCGVHGCVCACIRVCVCVWVCLIIPYTLQGSRIHSHSDNEGETSNALKSFLLFFHPSCCIRLLSFPSHPTYFQSRFCLCLPLFCVCVFSLSFTPTFFFYFFVFSSELSAPTCHHCFSFVYLYVCVADIT